MNRRLLAIALLCLSTTYIYSKQSADSLITRNYTTGKVVITGTRHEANSRHSSQILSVVNRKDIENTMQSSLLPVLTEQVPGLFATARGIMGFGVSGGAAGNISIRGLSGGSGRIMVLIDGHPQYMGLMGHPIADVFQSFLAERVEVLHGSASVLYGSNAMGGVVNIVTRQAEADKIESHLHAGYGSYNTLETNFTNRINKGKISTVISGSYNRTDGHRHNMGFEQYGGLAKIGYNFSAHWNASTDINVTHFNASQPGSISTPLLDAYQQVTRGTAAASINNKYERTSGAVSLFYNWGKHWINDGYTPNATPQEYRFRSKDYMFGATWYQDFSLFKGNKLITGIDYFGFGGKAENRYVAGSRKGENDLLTDKFLYEIAGYADFNQVLGKVFTLNAGLRIDHHSEKGTEWIPQLGFSLRPTSAMILKASARKGFRNPTIREMYLFPPQNPNLKPESLWDYEFSFTHQLLNNRLRYGINVFYIDGKDLIITTPRNGATPLNINTGTIRNYGLETYLSYLLTSTWSVSTNYSFLHQKNPVPAAPTHKLNVEASYTKKLFTVSTNLQYISGLYTSVSPEQKEKFILWNIRAKYHFSKHFSVWTKGENLLAQSYEINAGYPMPKATVMAGIDINF